MLGFPLGTNEFARSPTLESAITGCTCNTRNCSLRYRPVPFFFFFGIHISGKGDVQHAFHSTLPRKKMHQLKEPKFRKQHEFKTKHGHRSKTPYLRLRCKIAGTSVRPAGSWAQARSEATTQLHCSCHRVQGHLKDLGSSGDACWQQKNWLHCHR